MSSEREGGETAIERIRRYQMNAFDGEQIAADLELNAELWEAVWMNWEVAAPDTLHLSTASWDNASRLLEIAAYWHSDGFEAHQNAGGSWTLGGWWD